MNTATHKNFYIAASVSDENNKYYAYIIKTSESENILSALSKENIMYANLCPTKKYAEELVAYWNQCYQNNGTYMYDNSL